MADIENVVDLPTAAKKNHDSCFSVIKQAVELAAGSMESVALVVVRSNGAVTTGYHIGGNSFTLLGAAETLKYRVQSEKLNVTPVKPPNGA